MQLDPNPLRLSKFAWSVNDKTLTAEISDFGRGFNWSRLYDDAADMGLALYNPKTGSITRWALVPHLLRDDNQFWTLHPCTESVLKYPAVAGWKMTIIND